MNGEEIQIPVDQITLHGFLSRPGGSNAMVIFAHGSGSSRFSPRNQHVAQVLNAGGLGTLLCDLLSSEEQQKDEQDGSLRFDIKLLSRRLSTVVDWANHAAITQKARIGLFGASTGAAAALLTAYERSREIECIVSRGGRPDLAKSVLEAIKAPTLFIVGEKDTVVLDLNETAAAQMKVKNKVMIIPGATHLFEEPGTLDQAAHLACTWFKRYLTKQTH